MRMVYKVVYVEDQDAGSVLKDLKRFGLEPIHCKPITFAETVSCINGSNPDLILMDYKLLEGGGETDAPALAQSFRSQGVEDASLSIPIVLLSNNSKMQNFYKDFTSNDLFDFSINKEKFHQNLDKYTTLMKELIESYKEIKERIVNKQSVLDLLEIPDNLIENIDPRIVDFLKSVNSDSTYQVSGFILDKIVKPIGVLIGEDVLTARLGVSKGSVDWNDLLQKFEQYRYKGVYSGAYKRWWAEGIQYWWRHELQQSLHLRRLSAEEKLIILKEQFPEIELERVEGDASSVTRKFWTICHHSYIPIDPSEAFEKKNILSEVPWVEPEYYSYDSVCDNDLFQQLSEIDKERFKALAKGY
ncbi:hypothetical protein [Thiomicrorhabdus indica]|uniref:hypothetical protein n=1 Tax=Thiomicrorhabdus indica TaxID=2267253 RepID=UPI00102E020B|nr:hypothetical protein [Thiomicrorhabdus indica]